MAALPPVEAVLGHHEEATGREVLIEEALHLAGGAEEVRPRECAALLVVLLHRATVAVKIPTMQLLVVLQLEQLSVPALWPCDRHTMTTHGSSLTTTAHRTCKLDRRWRWMRKLGACQMEHRTTDSSTTMLT